MYDSSLCLGVWPSAPAAAGGGGNGVRKLMQSFLQDLSTKKLMNECSSLGLFPAVCAVISEQSKMPSSARRYGATVISILIQDVRVQLFC